jgi:hypothetical protein
VEAQQEGETGGGTKKMNFLDMLNKLADKWDKFLCKRGWHKWVYNFGPFPTYKVCEVCGKREQGI